MENLLRNIVLFMIILEPEELNEEKFNRFINLGINAEDMYEMIKTSFPKENISLEDLKPYFSNRF